MSGPEIGFTQESLQSYHLPVLRFITSLQILPRALTQCSDRHIGCRCGEKYHRAGILLPPLPLISDVKIQILLTRVRCNVAEVVSQWYLDTCVELLSSHG